MLRITEAGRRFRLRIVLKCPSQGTNQTGILRFTPPFAREMHATAMSRFARARTATVAFHHRQLRWLRRPLGQHAHTLWDGVPTRCQFTAHISHDALDRTGRDGDVPHFIQRQLGAIKRSCLGGCVNDSLNQSR